MHLYLSSKFSPSHLSYRQEIRKSLRNKIFQFTGQDFSQISDLSKIPISSANYYSSISHCRKIGGFVLSSKIPIGFDVEEISRINKQHLYSKIIFEEKEKKISLSDLWTLKESAIKSLYLLNKKAFSKNISIQKTDDYLKKIKIFDISQQDFVQKINSCLKKTYFEFEDFNCSKIFHLRFQNLKGQGICLKNSIFSMSFVQFRLN